MTLHATAPVGSACAAAERAAGCGHSHAVDALEVHVLEERLDLLGPRQSGSSHALASPRGQALPGAPASRPVRRPSWRCAPGPPARGTARACTPPPAPSGPVTRRRAASVRPAARTPQAPAQHHAARKARQAAARRASCDWLENHRPGVGLNSRSGRPSHRYVTRPLPVSGSTSVMLDAVGSIPILAGHSGARALRCGRVTPRSESGRTLRVIWSPQLRTHPAASRSSTSSSGGRATLRPTRR
jgi:hypothetical protein